MATKQKAARKWFGWAYRFQSSEGPAIKVRGIYVRFEVGQVLHLEDWRGKPITETLTVLKRWPAAPARRV
jgi:hypothetical protein